MDQPKYRIEIFWAGEDGGYIANVPDLRYCSAFGDTYEEALREVLVAMELHLDTLREQGRPIPDPGSHRVIGVSSGESATGRSVQIVEGDVVSSVEDVSAEVVEVVDSVVEAIGQGMAEDLRDLREEAVGHVTDEAISDEAIRMSGEGEAGHLSGEEGEVRSARRRRRR
jgi:predicted RNase H-like HicB family nuclease